MALADGCTGATRVAHDCIKEMELKEYEELVLEVIWEITVENFPAFIAEDDEGTDFFAESR